MPILPLSALNRQDLLLGFVSRSLFVKYSIDQTESRGHCLDLNIDPNVQISTQPFKPPCLLLLFWGNFNFFDLCWWRIYEDDYTDDGDWWLLGWWWHNLQFVLLYSHHWWLRWWHNLQFVLLYSHHAPFYGFLSWPACNSPLYCITIMIKMIMISIIMIIHLMIVIRKK